MWSSRAHSLRFVELLAELEMLYVCEYVPLLKAGYVNNLTVQVNNQKDALAYHLSACRMLHKANFKQSTMFSFC